jgi:transposase
MNPRRYELTDYEWSIIQPLLPNKPAAFRALTIARC